MCWAQVSRPLCWAQVMCWAQVSRPRPSADRRSQGVVDAVQPLHPHRRLLQFLVHSPLLVAVEILRHDLRCRSPAVVPFVVQHHDRHAVVQFGKDAPREVLRRLRSLVDHLVAGVAFLVLRLRVHHMPVGDEHLPMLHQRPVLDRHEVELLVVVPRHVGTQHLQAFLHRQVGAADQYRVRELCAVAVAAAIAECPRDQHRHDHGLARPGCHLAPEACQREQGLHGGSVDQRREELLRPARKSRLLPRQQAPQVVIGQGEPLEPCPRRPPRHPHLRQVDDRLDSFPLAEEQPPRQVGSTPMVQQLPRDRLRASVARFPPPAHIVAKRVDQRQVVALLFREQPALLRAGDLRLVPVPRSAPLRLQTRLAALGVIHPVLSRFFVRAAEDGLFDGLDGEVFGWFCAFGCRHSLLRCSVVLSGLCVVSATHIDPGMNPLGYYHSVPSGRRSCTPLGGG